MTRTLPRYTRSGWGGCPVEPRDAAGNLYPKAYAPKGVPGFTPFYYNVPSTGLQGHDLRHTTSGKICKVAQHQRPNMGVPLTCRPTAR